QPGRVAQLPGKRALIRCRRPSASSDSTARKTSRSSSPHRESQSMKKTGFDLVAGEEPDVSREPPDSPRPLINWIRLPESSDHVPSKAEARISEGQVLCAGEAASPASVWESPGLIIATVAESVHVRGRHTCV
ncbi:hypothetical protein N431DRAFT_526830, partial [Stipitochalara longipes BDJ]